MVSAALKILSLAAATAMAAAALPDALAQEKPWPSKAIRFIMPYPAGGPTDALARQITGELRDALGQPVVVENVAGAGGGVGLGVLAAAPADGYTIGYGQTSNLTINPHLYPASSLKYDSLKDFTPVALLVEASNVLIVGAKEPYRTLADLVAAGKARPGMLTYGSGGNGTGGHLASEMLASATGAKFLHVPYKGNAPAHTDLIAGNINFMMSLPIDAVPFARDGRVRMLATTGRRRLDIGTGVPTVAETIPGFEVVSWAMVLGPAGLPREIAQRLSDEIAKILRKPEVVERLTRQGWDIAYGNPEQAMQTLRKDFVRWGPIVKASGAKVD